MLQSMVSSPVEDRENFLSEARGLWDLGCGIIRVAIFNSASLDIFRQLRNQLPDGIGWVADVHFRPDLALACLQYFEKVRINPGNFGPCLARDAADYDDQTWHAEEEKTAVLARKFFERARELGRSVRVGVNGGSLSLRLISRFGHSSRCLVESAKEFEKMAREVGFEDLVFSFKTTNLIQTLDANRLAYRELGQYPFHLGVTEAGRGIDGRVKAALLIGLLAGDGIGNTVRISLSEKSENEIRFGKKILSYLRSDMVIADLPLILKRLEEIVESTAAENGRLTTADHEESDIIKNEDVLLDIIFCVLSKCFKGDDVNELLFRSEFGRAVVASAAQYLGGRKLKTEVVSCPTCGRTRYDVAGLARKLEARLGNYPGVKIAVMGCFVNGLGEMADADYGCVGEGSGKVSIYGRGECLFRKKNEDEALILLEKMLQFDRMNKRPNSNEVA